MYPVFALGLSLLCAAEPPSLVWQLLEQNAGARALAGDVETVIRYEETRYTSHADAARMEAGLAAEVITLPNGVASAVGGAARRTGYGDHPSKRRIYEWEFRGHEP